MDGLAGVDVDESAVLSLGGKHQRLLRLMRGAHVGQYRVFVDAVDQALDHAK